MRSYIDYAMKEKEREGAAEDLRPINFGQSRLCECDIDGGDDGMHFCFNFPFGITDVSTNACF